MWRDKEHGLAVERLGRLGVGRETNSNKKHGEEGDGAGWSQDKGIS